MSDLTKIVLIIIAAALIVLSCMMRYKKGGLKKMIYGILIAAASVYIAMCVALFSMQSRFLYVPFGEISSTPSDIGLKYDNLTLESTNGNRINAWYIPADGAKFTILVCHGNGGNLSHRIETIRIFHNLGLNCMIFDYQGYGESEGKPGEKATYDDARAAYTWLTEQKMTSADDIIIFGRSLGAAIAANLASEKPHTALVLESGFSSFVDIGRAYYPFLPIKLFAKYKYETCESLNKVTSPVMVFHSREDNIVPFRLGEKIFACAAEPKRFVEISGDHNNGFMRSLPSYSLAWSNFIKSLSETAIGQEK